MAMDAVLEMWMEGADVGGCVDAAQQLHQLAQNVLPLDRLTQVKAVGPDQIGQHGQRHAHKHDEAQAAVIGFVLESRYSMVPGIHRYHRQ